MTFSMWSGTHALFIASPVCIAWILDRISRGRGKEYTLKTGLWVSIFALFFLILRNGEIFVKNGWALNEELIPLQICHLAHFILIAAFWRNSRVLFSLAFCLNLPAALSAIIFANSLENYRSILTFRAQGYLWGHAFIAGITVWACLSGLIRLDRKLFLKTTVLIASLFGGSVIVNNLFTVLFDFRANNFYSLRPQAGTPLEFFYSLGRTYHTGCIQLNPVYLLCVTLSGLVVSSLFFVGAGKLYRACCAPVENR